ncbi:hypothetical protein MFM001_13430 [Mycobacterium sp. MFM001]|nr:hypothetical protein MFM001_13430 [Mycobacterium sp. MFM001]
MRRFRLNPKLRCSPVTSRASSRRPPENTTAVTAQLRSSDNAPASAMAQKVPMLANIQYQKAITAPVPPQAAM